MNDAVEIYDDGAAWHQIENEHRRMAEDALLANDPGYAKWSNERDQDDRKGEMEDSEMPLIVKDTGGGDFTIAPAGQHVAICDRVIDLGMQETSYGLKHKLMIRFQLPNERVSWEKDGEELEGPQVAFANYTASLSEKANLRQDLESWRGRSFTQDELDGFDVMSVLGAPCQLTIVHNPGEGSKVWANIRAITPLLKGMEKPQPEGDVFGYSPDSPEHYDKLSEKMQEKVTKGHAMAAAQSENPAPNGNGGEPDFDDDIPF